MGCRLLIPDLSLWKLAQDPHNLCIGINFGSHDGALTNVFPPTPSSTCYCRSLSISLPVKPDVPYDLGSTPNLHQGFSGVRQDNHWWVIHKTVLSSIPGIWEMPASALLKNIWGQHTDEHHTAIRERQSFLTCLTTKPFISRVSLRTCVWGVHFGQYSHVPSHGINYPLYSSPKL